MSAIRTPLPSEVSIGLTAKEAEYLGVAHYVSEIGGAVLAAGGEVDLPTTKLELYGSIHRPEAIGLRLLDRVSNGLSFEYAGILEEPEYLLPTAVDGHLDRVRRSLQAHNMAHTVRRAVEIRGLLPPVSLRGYRRLTPNETFTLGLISRGWRNAQIAERFGLGAGVVDQYARAAYRSLGVSGPFEAVRFALSNGSLLPDYRVIGGPGAHEPPRFRDKRSG